MKTLTFIVIGIVAAAALSGCSSSPRTTQERASLEYESKAALTRFVASDPSLQALLDSSAGYIVLPEVGKGGFIVGASYGHGEVFEKGSLTGYAELAEGTIGFQIGAQVFSELIVFRTAAALADFKADGFSFAANATAVAIKPGAAATIDPGWGVVAFTHIKGGLMAEAAIGGQKLSFIPK